MDDIVTLILIEEKRIEEEPILSRDYVYRRMDVVSKSNPSLRNPLNLEALYFHARQTPLSGDEQIESDYFVFDYGGHDESVYLREYGSPDEVEARITGGAGIVNPFTTYMFAIIRGQIKQYEVALLNKNTGQQRVFDKQREYSLSPSEHDLVVFKWLDERG